MPHWALWSQDTVKNNLTQTLIALCVCRKLTCLGCSKYWGVCTSPPLRTQQFLMFCNVPFVPGKVSSTGVSSLSDVEMAAAIQAWRSSVEGREMIMGQTFPISVDELFTQLFTNSKFYIDFHTSRKSFGKQKTTHLVKLQES